MSDHHGGTPAPTVFDSASAWLSVDARRWSEGDAVAGTSDVASLVRSYGLWSVGRNPSDREPEKASAIEVVRSIAIYEQGRDHLLELPPKTMARQVARYAEALGVAEEKMRNIWIWWGQRKLGSEGREA